MRLAFATSSVMLAGLVLGACAGVPNSLLTTGSIKPAVEEHPTRSTPAVAGRPARVFIMVAFKEKDCTALTPDIKVTQPPVKGAVSFRPNQMTRVQFSQSGKCTDQQLPGTGIYYTAKAGQTGTDSFTVEASTPSGQIATRTFHLRVVD